MKNCTLRKVVLMMFALMFAWAYAQDGAPHTLSATANFKQVVLNWRAPSSVVTLQWHNDYDYNGMDGVQYDPEGMLTFYAANKFSAKDLTNFVGLSVDKMGMFRYMNPYKVEYQIYENEVLVYSQPVDLSGYVKNTWKIEELKTPYVIPSGKDVMFVVKYTYGANQELMAITDKYPQKGKGDIFSYDGKKWLTGGYGDFLVTAFLKNNANATPDGYNVYRDGVKVNTALLTDTVLTLDNEEAGVHAYKVGAVYGGEEKVSYSVDATSVDPLNVYQSVASVNGSIDGLKAQINWQAPLKTANLMTWCNQTPGISIGGTSSTSPKVWIKQEFEKEDMIAYPSHKLTAINVYLAEKVITGATLFVIKDGVIDYFEAVSDEAISALEANAWAKFTLSTPYNFQMGSNYSFGCYFTHSASAHPIGVDTGLAVNVKGNSFSVSSPTSSGFQKSKPSWKTLASGNITGNFMLTGDVEAITPFTGSEVAGYDVYRDDQKIASDVKAETFTDEVTDLGIYTYSVVAKSVDGKISSQKSIDLEYKLPAEYEAPLITKAQYDEESKNVNIQWNAEAVELKHYDTPTYLAGFDEDMDLLYGSKFTVEELLPYVGYKINTLKFVLGAALSSFKLEIYTSKGENIFSQDMDGSQIAVGALYSMDLDSPVTIPAGVDLYLVYNAALPAGTDAMILDKGPAVDNGAVISLTGGVKWLNLGTIATDYKDYNLVIGAIAIPSTEAANAPQKSIELQKTFAKDGNMQKITISSKQVKEAAQEGYGVAPSILVEKAPIAKATASAKPKPSSFRVYCNNSMAVETDASSFKETINSYGEFVYYVTSVFPNGWESPASKKVYLSNMIPQKPVAPYDLTGSISDSGLNLKWKVASESPVMTYETGSTDTALGMTGSGVRESYCAIRYSADDMATKGLVGQCVSHITFKLADVNLNSASVFLMNGDNIIFEQPVEVSDLVVGLNTVRLNKDIPLDDSNSFSVGYHITYASGVKPMVCDAGPAVSGSGDLISSSASSGYWYSLKTKFKFDCNWRISATFKKVASKLAPKAISLGDEATYIVYCNGVAIAQGLEDCQYTVFNPKGGLYTVTCFKTGVESAESNAVEYVDPSGVEGVESQAKAYYDKNAQSIIAPEAVNATIYSVNGKILKQVDDATVVGMSEFEAGIYVVRLSNSQVIKVIK